MATDYNMLYHQLGRLLETPPTCQLIKLALNLQRFIGLVEVMHW